MFLQANPNAKETLGYLNVFLKNWKDKLKILAIARW
jgi:hypothetical protein